MFKDLAGRRIPKLIRIALGLGIGIVPTQCAFADDPVPAAKDPIAINIHVAAPWNGGFGDVASNTYMAQQLKRVMPQTKIRILYGGSVQTSMIATLVQGFDPEKNDQTIDGLEYINTGYRLKLPQSDLGLGFSYSESMSHGDADRAFTFQEYGFPPGDTKILRAPLTRNMRAGRRIKRVSFPRDPLVYMATGARSTGLYVVPGDLKPPLSRAEVTNQLGVSHDSLFGFCYTKYPRATVAYLTALASRADRIPPGKTLVVMTPDFPELDSLHLPSNIHLKRNKAPKFSLSESVLAYSDVPVGVTGDVSMTLALQYRKLPVIETLSHKTDSVRDVIEVLRETNPDLRQIGFSNIAELGKPGHEKAVAHLFFDPLLTKFYRAAVDNRIYALSLPILIKNLYRIPRERLPENEEGFRRLIEALQHGGDPRKLMEDPPAQGCPGVFKKLLRKFFFPKSRKLFQ